MTAPLSYKALQTTEIRLIELLPNHSEVQVKCRLFTVSLDNVPAYEALSYVWGDASVTRTVTCDGRAVQVTVSLATALHRLRSPEGGSSRFIWADVLSIDQSNLAEKSIQVPLMTRIYSAATGVVVWMGLEDTKPVMTAIAAIEYVHNAYQTLREASVEPTEHLEFSDLESHIQELGFDNVWSELNSFFTIPYWERVWCVQELNLAKEATFLVGSMELSRASVTSFTSWYVRRFVLEIGKGAHFDVSLKPGIAGRASAMLNYRGFQDLHTDDFCATLDRFRYARATNVRDKGLIGIHAHITRLASPVEVDYEKSVSQVYMETVLQSIQMTRSLNVLSYIEHGPRYDVNTEHPSWVPRWDRAESLGYLKLLHHKTTLSAGQHEAILSPPPSVHSRVLSLQGIMFDQAFRASKILPGVSWLERDREFRSLFAQFWFEVNGSSTFEHRLSGAELALTLTGGVTAFDKETGRHGKGEDPSEVVEELDSERGRRFMAYFYSFVRAIGLPDFGSDASQNDSEPYSMQAGLMCGTRRIFRTFGGYLGLGPGCMQPGDLVVVLDGGKLPYVLRPLEGSRYAFMGECFVYAIRNGEAYDMAEKNKLPKQTFELE